MKKIATIIATLVVSFSVATSVYGVKISFKKSFLQTNNNNLFDVKNLEEKIKKNGMQSVIRETIEKNNKKDFTLLVKNFKHEMKEEDIFLAFHNASLFGHFSMITLLVHVFRANVTVDAADYLVSVAAMNSHTNIENYLKNEFKINV